MVNQPAEARRLGKRQLGRHAFEECMPDRVLKITLEETESNRLCGVIPVLAELIDRDPKIKSAYLCHDEVVHLYKAKGEGDHFCGYRNIQMLLSNSNSNGNDRSKPTKGQIYSILELQTLIEEAWDLGFNSHGRIETGGIKNTRKHIGTSEAQALLEHLGMAGPAEAFYNPDGSRPAYKDLLDYVEGRFAAESTKDSSQETKVHRTLLGPIYLQRPRHSLTIVGIQRQHDDSRSLLVFDPGYDPPKDLKRALSTGTGVKHPKSVLKAYQRSERYLKRYRGFETLQMSG